MPSSVSAAWEMMGTCSRVGGRGGRHSSWSGRGAQLPYHGPQLHGVAAHGARWTWSTLQSAAKGICANLCRINSFQVFTGTSLAPGSPPAAHPASDLSSARKFPTIRCRFPEDLRPVTRYSPIHWNFIVPLVCVVPCPRHWR